MGDFSNQQKAKRRSEKTGQDPERETCRVFLQPFATYFYSLGAWRDGSILPRK